MVQNDFCPLKQKQTDYFCIIIPDIFLRHSNEAYGYRMEQVLALLVGVFHFCPNFFHYRKSDQS